jgi:hypothetical protein
MAITDVGATLRTGLEESGHSTITFLLGLTLLLVASALAIRSADQGKPPMLRETIPFLSNTYQYMSDMDTFLSRVT